MSVESYKLMDLVKSATIGQNFGTVVVTYSISDTKWSRLPKEARDVLAKAGDEISLSACKNFDAQETKAADDLTAKGAKLIRFDASDQAKIDAAMAKVATDWAKTLDGRGKPGSETLKAFRAALSAASQ